VFDNCRGIALETVDGAIIEDITVDNIAMRDIWNSPIYIRLGNRARGPKELPVSVVRRVKLSNIVVKNADCRYASILFGLEGHPIEDVTLSNIYIQYKGGLTMDDVIHQRGANSFFTRVNSAAHGTRQSGGEQEPEKPGRPDPFDVPDMEKGYPEPSSHGILPAYGLFIKHAKNVRVDKVEFETLQEDQRPAIVLMNVDGIKFTEVEVDKSAEAPYFVLKNVRNFQVEDFVGVKDKNITSAENQEIYK